MIIFHDSIIPPYLTTSTEAVYDHIPKFCCNISRDQCFLIYPSAATTPPLDPRYPGFIAVAVTIVIICEQPTCHDPARKAAKLLEESFFTPSVLRATAAHCHCQYPDKAAV